MDKNLNDWTPPPKKTLIDKLMNFIYLNIVKNFEKQNLGNLFLQTKKYSSEVNYLNKKIKLYALNISGFKLNLKTIIVW